MVSLVILLFLAPVFGGVILPNESVVRGEFAVSEPYRSYDRKFGMDQYYDMKFGVKGYPSTYQIAAVDHDIKHQLSDLERNLAAARPYLATNPQILHEAEEQLRTLQHIHADRLLQGIESIRQLELQQEVLIHKVNSQLETSVNQLKHLAVLQQEISNKQKSAPVRSDTLPESTIEASRHLTAQLHAIEAAKAQEAAAHEIAKDAMAHAVSKEVVDHAIAKEVMDQAIAKEVVDRAIAKEVVEHAIAKEMAQHARKDDFPRKSGISSDEGVLRDSSIEPRSPTTSKHSDSQGRADEEENPFIFGTGR